VRSIARWTSRRQASDGIPPHATDTPRRAPIARHLTEDLNVGEFVLRPLPAEDRNLLTAYPAATAPAARGLLATLALATILQRPPCRILDASREYEVAVGQNLAMLADQDHVAVTR